MRLIELEPQFVSYEGEKIKHHLSGIEGAQGVWFLCPSCFQKNGGAVGTHLIEVSFADRGLSDAQGSHNREGKPSRWTVIGGTGYGDLTLNPSVLCDPAGDCPGWHGFITNGEARVA